MRDTLQQLQIEAISTWSLCDVACESLHGLSGLTQAFKHDVSPEQMASLSHDNSNVLKQL